MSRPHKKTERVAVIGAGGHAKVVVASLRAMGHEVVTLVDDDPTKRGTLVAGLAVTCGLDSFFRDAELPAVIAVGDNEQRKALARRLDGVRFLSAIHPSAVVHESVRVDAGTVVFAGAVIQPDTLLGHQVIVNTSAGIDHDCRVEAFAHIAPGAHLAGEVHVGEGALVGIGAAVIPGRRIGASATVGAGAVVVSDIPAGAVVYGVPARTMKAEQP